MAPGGPPGAAPASRVDVSIAVDQDRFPISPFIYGSNQEDGANVWTVRRSGGNRSTGYNWENNFSNAGSDYFHNSDLYALSSEGISLGEAAVPARAVTHFHDRSIATGAESVVSLQMAGFVANDGNGPVLPTEVAPSLRWARVEARKPTPFASIPDRGDGVVYMDEFVHHLVQRYGRADAPNGVRWYSLDNEPELWPSTHPRIHPAKTGAVELVTRSIALASAVKAVDPQAEILGWAAYGIAAYVSLQDAPDWPQVRQDGGAEWFTDYYLTSMRNAEQREGKRLLDVLDVHWYPEARGDHRITDGNATTARDAVARIQAPRTLWDSTYREESWVTAVLGGFLPILPRLQRSIERSYPGTKLAITEYNYGGGSTISGGLAQADVLGVFGKYGVYLATIWAISRSDTYTSAAFKLFRDYDGQRGAFGNTSVRATTSDAARTSVYASIHGSDPSVLHLILLNKHERDTLGMRVQLSGGASYSTGEVWGFDAQRAPVTARPAIRGITGNAFEYPLPPLTAVHLVLR